MILDRIFAARTRRVRARGSRQSRCSRCRNSSAQPGETTSVIRDWLTQLHNCRALIRGLRGTASPGVLRELTTAAAGHVIDPDQLLREVGLHGFVGEKRQPRADADVQAMVGLSRALGWALSHLPIVDPWITTWSSDDRLHPVSRFNARGPLAVAYLETIADASTLSVGFESGRRSVTLGPRVCEWCGRTFAPRVYSQHWCSRTCRWAGLKAASRGRARGAEDP